MVNADDGGYVQRLHDAGLNANTGKPLATMRRRSRVTRAQRLYAASMRRTPPTDVTTGARVWESGRSIEYREALRRRQHQEHLGKSLRRRTGE